MVKRNHLLTESMIIIFSFLLSGSMIAQVSIKGTVNGKMRIASCQFPVSANIKENLQWVCSQMVEANLKKANIVHFPECALSGYAGADLKSMDGYNWEELHQATDSVRTLAKQLNITVLLGSMHRLSGNKPHNSLYLITPDGAIADRYDKRFCTASDLKHYTPGDHFVTFDLNGINCGLLICYDVRFPELYREYKKLNAQVIFQSFYNARSNKTSIHPVIMHITAQGHAASNYFYMSLTNSSDPESWPCYFITPDGLVQNKLPENRPGVLISDIDLSTNYYDASKDFRMDAMNGKLNSGTAVKDSLSIKRRNNY